MQTHTSIDQDFIKKLTEIILDNLSNEHFGIDDLAHLARMDRTLIHHRLMETLGKSTTQFIREVRLRRALEMLQEEELTAAEVAYKVGFGSPAYFNTCFHEHFGFTPGEAKNIKKDDPGTNRAGEIPKTYPKKLTRKTALYISVGVLILVAVYLLFNNLSFKSFSILPGTRLEANDKSIAVLPFKNLSGENENQYFAEGVTENILNNLIQITEIKVISNPVKLFGENPKDFRKIAHSLGIRFILSGSVQRSGNRVLIIPKLIDTKKNNQLIWSHRYDKKLADIFQIQRDIATQIASELQAIIPKNKKERISKIPTTSQEAYENYLMGRYLLERRPHRDENVSKYTTPFEKAIAVDSNYAEAYVGLAYAYLIATGSQSYPRPEGFIKAKENVDHALKLDPNLAEAHATLGNIYRYEWKWEEARKEMEIALHLNPNSSETQSAYADLMFILRDRKAYKIHIAKAIELNPISRGLIRSKAYLYKDEGNVEKELEEYNKIIELYPNNYSNYFYLWHIYRKMGEDQKAVEALQKAYLYDPTDRAFSDSIPLIYKNKGLKGLEKRNYEYIMATDLKGSWRGLARYCVETGNKEKALDWLEKAYEWEIPSLPDINADPAFDPIRNEPRFQALIAKMGLTKYQ